MSALTLEALRFTMPQAGVQADKFFPALDSACDEFEINTPIRVAAFIAQIAHESMELRRTSEIWGPTSWQAGYEGRKDLGNTEPGDGYKYRGRGLLQITGRANYVRCASDLKIPCVESPELLETPINASRSAAWFWKGHGLNTLADEGDFVWITKRINGGTNGLTSRIGYWTLAKKALGVP